MPPILVMLHGANGSGETMLPLADALRPFAQVETPNLLGHGGRPVPERLSMPELADDVVAYLDSRQIARAYLFGYSFGGYLALYLARHFPQRLDGICVLAVKYVFDEPTVKRWTHLTNPERLRRPGSPRPAELTRTHFPQDWAAITTINQNLFKEFGANPPLTEADLRSLALPAFVVSADQDQLVPLPETHALGKLIPGSLVGIFSGEAHPLLACPIPALASAIGKWLGEVEAARNAG
jgi:pimeloyl-ACP methyl ester carboxylesterase